MQDCVHQKCTDDVMVDWEIDWQSVRYLYTCDTCVSLLADANKDVNSTGVFTYLISTQITNTYIPSNKHEIFVS